MTCEATLIEDFVRFYRAHHGNQNLESIGLVLLGVSREAMIEDLDWSRNHFNKHVRRLAAMFNLAAQQELVAASTAIELKSVSGLKKGSTRPRETSGVRYLSDAAVEAILTFLQTVASDLVRFQRLTGPHPGEVCPFEP